MGSAPATEILINIPITSLHLPAIHFDIPSSISNISYPSLETIEVFHDIPKPIINLPQHTTGKCPDIHFHIKDIGEVTRNSPRGNDPPSILFIIPSPVINLPEGSTMQRPKVEFIIPPQVDTHMASSPQKLKGRLAILMGLASWDMV